MTTNKVDKEQYIPRIFEACGHDSYEAYVSSKAGFGCYECLLKEFYETPNYKEYKEIKDFIGYYRLGSLSLTAWMLNTSSFWFLIRPQKLSKIRKRMFETLRSLPSKGGQTLTMRRYTPTTDWKDQLKEKYEESKDTPDSTRS